MNDRGETNAETADTPSRQSSEKLAEFFFYRSYRYIVLIVELGLHR
jgi:hypothetical protein